MKQLLIIVSMFFASVVSAQSFRCFNSYELNDSIVQENDTIMFRLGKLFPAVCINKECIDSFKTLYSFLEYERDSLSFKEKENTAMIDSLKLLKKSKSVTKILQKKTLEQEQIKERVWALKVQIPNEKYWRERTLDAFLGGRHYIRSYIRALVPDFDAVEEGLCPNGAFTYQGKIVCTKASLPSRDPCDPVVKF